MVVVRAPRRDYRVKSKNAAFDPAAPRAVGFIAFDGISALDLIGPLETFASASGGGERYSCRIFALSRHSIRTEAGTIIRPEAVLSKAAGLDTLIIPGGKGLREPSISRPIVQWLLENASSIRRVATVCTGIYALAPTGLLDGRRVTTHWRFADDVRRCFPALRVEPDHIFLRDGRFFTSAGVTAGIDLALSMIEADHGRRLAVEVARELVVYLKRSGGQEQYSSPLRLQARSSDDLADLTVWMSNNLRSPLTVEVLAERANVSARHLQRRFQAVFGQPTAAVVERLRLDAARDRLSEGKYPIESVAEAVGFQSADVFRRAFLRRYGTRPSDYRDRFATDLDSAPKARRIRRSDERSNPV